MFSRAYVSLGQSIRIAQLLKLNLLDQEKGTGDGVTPKSAPITEDWVDLEARRRTWWIALIGDRLVFATTGLPVLINDRYVSYDS